MRTVALDGVTPREISLSPEEVVVTTGSQQLLYLISQVLLDPGDIVLTEAPSYFVYQGTLNSLGVRTLSVPMDERGMNTEALEELLTRLDKTDELDRVRLIYTCDYFQNPSGRTLSLSRRQHMLELARRFSRRHVRPCDHLRQVHHRDDRLPRRRHLAGVERQICDDAVYRARQA